MFESDEYIMGNPFDAARFLDDIHEPHEHPVHFKSQLRPIMQAAIPDLSIDIMLLIAVFVICFIIANYKSRKAAKKIKKALRRPFTVL